MSKPAIAPALRRQPSLRLILFWQQCDRLSGALLCAMAVFSPWALGGTPTWAIRIMNFAGYALGGLLALKLFIRWFWNYRPARWNDAPASPGVRTARALTVALAVLTVAILAYCAVAALNARATYDEWSLNFNYREFIPWLPHSYDRDRTWRYFFNYLALALNFWAARDWLLGKTPAANRSARSGETEVAPGVLLPQRLRLLLWVLSLNGALLAGEALVQRLSGTEKLLWLLTPRLNAQADAQLGPFNYRSNGAQYLNLIWPVALGLWWRLRRAAHIVPTKGDWLRRYRHHWLLPCVFLMAATPILSLSRGGAIVTVVNMLAATAVLWFGWRHHTVLPRLGILLFFGLAFGLGLHLGGAKLGARFEEADEGFNSREEMYDTARRIAQDYPLFGTGPGTLDPVFQPYRKSTDEYWPAQLHNDWLETRVTFGWLGSALIGLAFVLVLARCLLPGGVPTGWRLTLLIWVALGGCLLHARWDFPLQVYSILFLFLLHCAMLTTFSRRTLAN
jgi:O-antigen ligase